MEAISATETRNINGRNFTGTGKLLHGKKTGTWIYGPIIRLSPTSHKIYPLNTIVWENDVIQSCMFNESASDCMLSYSETIGNFTVVKYNFTTIPVPPITIDTTVIYSDIHTKYPATETTSMYIPAGLQSTPYKLKEYKDDGKTTLLREFNQSGIVQEKIESEHNTIVRRYFNLKDRCWGNSVINQANLTPAYFENLLIWERNNNRTKTTYRQNYRSLDIETKDFDATKTGNVIKTVIDITHNKSAVAKTTTRYFHLGIRVGITTETKTPLIGGKEKLVRKYFAFGNRKLDMNELNIHNNSEIDDSIVTFLRLKYK